MPSVVPTQGQPAVPSNEAHSVGATRGARLLSSAATAANEQKELTFQRHARLHLRPTPRCHDFYAKTPGPNVPFAICPCAAQLEICHVNTRCHLPYQYTNPTLTHFAISIRLCTSQLEMHLAIDAGMGGFGLSHDSFGARMGGTPERLYKCTQENLQVSSTTRPCL